MISVIMGVYNGEKTVKKAVLSITEGTYKDIEFIIADDGSIDNTYGVLKELAAFDPRIKIIHSEKNQGLAKALNLCLKLAKGDYIARMDADDVSYEDRLEKQLCYLKEHNKLDFISSAVTLTDEKGNIWGKRSFPINVTKEILIKYNPFVHPTLLIRKEVLININGYCEKKHCIRCEDYDLYFRLYAKGFIGGNIDTPLLYYYENEHSSLRHSFTSRKNEFIVRKNGTKLLKGSFCDYLYCIIPLILAFLPAKLYDKLHNAKWRKN